MNFEDVKKIIVDTLGCDEDKVTENASLTEDLEADSLDLVELHMALEDAIGTKIPDEVIAQLGNRVQHTLRAYTPQEQKVVKAAAMAFRVNPEFNTGTFGACIISLKGFYSYEYTG